jgi:hypothetical protein
MVADLINSKDGAKMYTIKGIFGLWVHGSYVDVIAVQVVRVTSVSYQRLLPSATESFSNSFRVYRKRAQSCGLQENL